MHSYPSSLLEFNLRLDINRNVLEFSETQPSPFLLQVPTYNNILKILSEQVQLGALDTDFRIGIIIEEDPLLLKHMISNCPPKRLSLGHMIPRRFPTRV